jgi:hypothetical protein
MTTAYEKRVGEFVEEQRQLPGETVRAGHLPLLEALQVFKKRIAVVGGFAAGCLAGSAEACADRSADSLLRQEVAKPGRTMGLRVVVPEIAIGLQGRLEESGELLAGALSRHDVAAEYDPEVLAVPEGGCGYETLHRGISELEKRRPAADLGFVAIMDAPYATDAFNLRHYSVVHHGRSGVMYDVGQSLEDIRWSG